MRLAPPWIDRLGYEGFGLSGFRCSPAACKLARLSYAHEIFYEGVHSTSWDSGEGKAGVDEGWVGEARSDDESGNLSSVDRVAGAWGMVDYLPGIRYPTKN